jgi:type VI secretion system protein ImpM
LAWGFYGKLPSQGDFVSRRLSWAFTEPWDAWMQAALGHAREALGADWLPQYLHAPVWRFRLAPGLAGPTGWLGLWFPSVDKVGRHFPLAVAAPLPPEVAATAALALDDAAWAALEQSALAALEPRTSLDSLESALAAAPTPALPLAAAEPAGPTLQVLADDADPSAAQAACDAAAAAPLLFFTWGSATVPPTVLRADAWPDAVQGQAFLNGHWGGLQGNAKLG